ncbi:anti-repressor protein [Escherichia coli]|uniref:BRO-N domain-containing protein n=1 Tax=Enterobacteriaceae TaxID=543 RepID=UPI0016B4DD22|nr:MULTISPECIES: BRO family protein [Enterobacteriaceae]DAQ51132.1 MAG TPA: repressor domain protein [Caudoviricetes sp.]EEW3306409.1 anti-repressor protein [Escherichia coli]EFA7325947.1 anti-repressor protein [Escherichia coli]EFC1815016.1 anti-repressor protein [Escherichia coli]EFC7970624.1 anti-repressor protein [Escherichia coli]
MSAQTTPTVFSFESTVNIRMVMIDQRPYFVAHDVCSALGIQSVDVALRKVDSDEKGTYSIRTRGGFQSLSVVNESGLYWLMLRCRKAGVEGTSAYRFRKWVTGEVLPQIRQTGRYVREELSPADKAQKVVASFMPAILEAMKSGEKQEYNVPLKPGYREHIHSPEGVLGLAEHSLLMNLLNRMQDDGHDVSGAAAEFTTMVSYIVGVSKCLNDIRTHAQYITKNTAAF